MPRVLPRYSNPWRRLSLRQRILLLFAGLGGASLLALLLGLYYGYFRNPNPWSLDAVIVGGVLSGAVILGLVFGMWRLFDLHVAIPIERLTGELRARAHAQVDVDLTDLDARHLDELASAAASMMRHLNEARNELAEAIARETTRQVIEKERLIALLSDLPAGVLMCTADHRLVMYNGEALGLLAQTPSGDAPAAAPCLDRSIFDYLDEEALTRAHRSLLEANDADEADIEVALTCKVCDTGRSLRGRMRLLGDRLSGGNGASRGYVLVIEPIEDSIGPALPATTYPPPLPRTAVYDFELLSRGRHADIAATPLTALNYVVLDTETTGLLPGSGDEIVQLAAVRIVNGRRVEAEVFDTLVNPGRSIPATSTQFHGITNEDVIDAPPVDQAVRRFHKFAQGAVLVAHNAAFDMAFLRRKEADIGLRFDHPVLDTVLLSALVFGEAEHHGLDALVARLGIPLPPELRHTAIGDATATAEALLKLIPALQARGVHTFGDVQGEIGRLGRLRKQSNTW